MSYRQEVQAIFNLTLSLLEKDTQFAPSLLTELRELCATENLESETAITSVLDHLVTSKETTGD